MNIFVYEHITGGGLIGSPMPASLATEGRMMRDALMRDLVAVPGVEIVTLRDARIAPPPEPVQSIVLSDRAQWDSAFDVIAAKADAVWPIAPETGGILERLSRRIGRAGRPLIGSSAEAVHVAASKRETHRALVACGVASVTTFSLDANPPDSPGPWVAKPDDGCGCADTYCFPDRSAALRWAMSRADASRFVLQPHVAGEVLSLCVLARDARAWLLCVNRQRMQLRDGAFVFTGTEVNAIADHGGDFTGLAQAVVAALPGLRGYCGIDVIQTPSGPMVIDVNPRLTTSWVGLGRALRLNPAALVLDLFANDGFTLPAIGGTVIDVRVGV